MIGKRSGRRPLDTKKSIHLTLKARQDFLLLKNRKGFEDIARKYATQFGLKLYSIAVQADHLHTYIKIPNRIFYVRWIRAVTSQLVRQVPGLKWSLRPHTRIVSWGRDIKGVAKYIGKNRGEAEIILEAHEIVRSFELKIRAALLDRNTGIVRYQDS